MSASPKPSRHAWFVVGALFIVALLNYMDRLMITTMRDPIRSEIVMTDAQFGLLTSVFLWVYAAVSPFGGFVADRVGRRWVIIASLFFWSLATGISGFSRTFNQMLLARGLMGISEACYIPAALALIADYHRGPSRSLATGLHMAGIYTGAALGGIGGYIAEDFGWRSGFRVLGMMGIAYGLVLIPCLRDAPLVVTDADLGEDACPPVPLPKPLTALAALFSDAGFRTLFALNIIVGVVNWAIYGWLPTYLRGQFRLGLGAAGMSATGYIQVASFAGVLVGGVISDRRSRGHRRARALVPAIGFLLAGPCLLSAASTTLLPIAIAGLVVFGLARGAFDANHMPILRELVNERYSATGYGFLNLVSTAAGGAMVYAGGKMMDWHVGLSRVFQGCGVGMVVVACLLVAIRFAEGSNCGVKAPVKPPSA